MTDRESRSDVPPMQLAFLEDMAKRLLSFGDMTEKFNKEFGTNWSRSKIGSLCYRRGWRVKAASEKAIRYIKVAKEGIVTGRAEFKMPPQQLPKIQPPSRRGDNRPPKRAPATLTGGTRPVPFMGLKPVAAKKAPASLLPSREMTIVELGYKTDCKYATTPFEAKPSEHRFCGHPVQPGRLYCEGHESMCHTDTPRLKKKA